MSDLSKMLRHRFGEDVAAGYTEPVPESVERMIGRGSCRNFQDREVDERLVGILCAAAMAAPTKSDLQQRDIVLVRDPALKARVVSLSGNEAWLPGVPNLVVFCGNNRRQRFVQELRGHPFVNDHLDAFFNATVDAGIALSAFVTAVEACGLGCCPVSTVRNHAEAVSRLLKLPDHLFPVAGLAFGHPETAEPAVSLRLPLSATVHVDSYGETDLAATVERYDRRREEAQPYAAQRATGTFGVADRYGWSEDKARQYALPERQDFGEFVRAKGFDLT